MATKKKPSRTDRAERLSDTLVAFRRSLLLSRLQGIAAVADIAHDFVSTIAEDEAVSTSKTTPELVRSVSDALSPALSDARDRLADVPGSVIDRFNQEFKKRKQATDSADTDPSPAQ